MLLGESNMGLENSESGNAVGTNEVMTHGSEERLKSLDVRDVMLNALVNEDDIRRVMDSRRCKDGACTEDMTVVVLEKRVAGINTRLTIPPGFSQSSTPFIACWRQDIPHMHLVAWPH
jgi:hypothetical protein